MFQSLWLQSKSFFWDEYFSFVSTSKFEIHCSKVLKYFFSQIYSHVTYQKTRIVTLNFQNYQISNQFSKNLKIYGQKLKKVVKFEMYKKKSLANQAISNNFEKLFDI